MRSTSFLFLLVGLLYYHLKGVTLESYSTWLAFEEGGGRITLRGIEPGFEEICISFK